MQITFLVGNGFDRACGLNTSYKSFYKWYCKREESDKEHVQTFREKIDEEIESDKWADFEEALGKYTNNFTKENAQDFIDCYNDARQKLIEYLQNQSDRFEHDVNEKKIDSMRHGLQDFYQELNLHARTAMTKLFQEHYKEEHIFRFVSFNYTTILDRCVEQLSQKGFTAWHDHEKGVSSPGAVLQPVIHAHGTLQYFPIFGVNDESQVNKELLSVPYFVETMIKPQAVSAIDEDWHSDAMGIIDDSSIICIYGMSMGMTDAQWFIRILVWLNGDEKRRVIVYWYSDDPSNGIDLPKYVRNKNEAQEALLKFAPEGMNKDYLKKRIYFIENTKNVLKIRLTKRVLSETGVDRS